MGINEYIKIGKRIRKLRMEKGYSQKEMAALCGIPYSTYSNYENNNREPGKEQIEKIAKVLEVSADDLIGYKKIIDKFTIDTIDNINYHIMRLLKEKDILSEKQQTLEENYNPELEESRISYACDADYIQFQLSRTFSDLDTLKDTLLEASNEKELSIQHKILFALANLNPEGEKKILEEIENLSYNPKYKVPIKPDDWDAFDDI